MDGVREVAVVDGGETFETANTASVFVSLTGIGAVDDG
jgi:hypothetical protein